MDPPPRCLVLFLTLFQSVNELLFCSSKSTQFVSLTPYIFESECKGTAFFLTSKIFSWKILENMQFLCFTLRFCWQLSKTKSVFSNIHFFGALVRSWWNTLDFPKITSVRNQAHEGIDWSNLWDCQKHICGYTKAFLWIQLVAERSLSKRRALGFSVKSNERFSESKGERQHIRRRRVVVYQCNYWCDSCEIYWARTEVRMSVFTFF